MPRHKNQRVAGRRDELTAKIGECEHVIREFENSESWRIVLKDIAETEKLIDNNWHLQTDKDKLDQMRVTKFAARQLALTVDKYKSDLQLAKQELYAIDNPNTVLNKYYDTESTVQ